MPDSTTADTAELTYSQAAEELSRIVAELESDRLDVDEVVVRVQRADALIRFCRDKVSAAQITVRQVTESLA